MTRQSSKHTERRGVCEGCDRTLMTAVFRKRRLCRKCMMADEVKPRLEDFVTGSCALGDVSRMQGEVPHGLSAGGPFDRAIIAAAKKRGCHWTREQENNLMFAGVKQK